MTTKQANIALSIILCAACLGCGVQSLQPLSDPAKAQVDDRLISVWKFRDAGELGQGEMFLHVGKKQLGPEGVAQCIFIQHSGGSTMSISKAAMFTTVIGEDKILNVRWATDSNDGRYAFFRYDFHEGDLQLYPPRSTVVAEAVRRGELEGSISSGVLAPHVALRSTSDELYKFVAQSDTSVLFGETTNLVFTRVAD